MNTKPAKELFEEYRKKFPTKLIENSPFIEQKTQNSETRLRKEKKKDRCNQDYVHNQDQRAQKGSTSAHRVNASKKDESNLKKNKNKDKNHLDMTAYDTIQVTY